MFCSNNLVNNVKNIFGSKTLSLLGERLTIASQFNISGLQIEKRCYESFPNTLKLLITVLLFIIASMYVCGHMKHGMHEVITLQLAAFSIM